LKLFSNFVIEIVIYFGSNLLYVCLIWFIRAVSFMWSVYWVQVLNFDKFYLSDLLVLLSVGVPICWCSYLLVLLSVGVPIWYAPFLWFDWLLAVIYCTHTHSHALNNQSSSAAITNQVYTTVTACVLSGADRNTVCYHQSEERISINKIRVRKDIQLMVMNETAI